MHSRNRLSAFSILISINCIATVVPHEHIKKKYTLMTQGFKEYLMTWVLAARAVLRHVRGIAHLSRYQERSINQTGEHQKCHECKTGIQKGSGFFSVVSRPASLPQSRFQAQPYRTLLTPFVVTEGAAGTNAAADRFAFRFILRFVDPGPPLPWQGRRCQLFACPFMFFFIRSQV